MRWEGMLQPGASPVTGAARQHGVEFCKLGHPLSGDNVVVENRNGREFKRCRTCRREAWKSWQRQKTAENKRAKSKPGKRSK